IGDTVLIQKAGEIIPEIVSVIEKDRPEGTIPYVLPDTCPVCGAPVVRDEDGAAIRCTGAQCPAQRVRHLVHFASRDAMDIEGLVGTLAGDDTAFIAMKDREAAENFEHEVGKFL
ncbi:MAG: hypothetical protein EOM14_09725, partial [Clostridia bacterium]|nr:hypothetical protein [Clostridia bacterium]